MDDIASFPHHPVLEEIADVLCTRTERNAAPFFRVLTIYYLGLMASSMRAKIQSNAFKEFPINNYVIALAVSGFGKGKSTGILENELLCDFRPTFQDFVMGDQAQRNMAKIASRLSALSGRSEDEEYSKLEKDFIACGEYPMVFDGGSEAAIKQIRHMLLLADCGSLNLQIDEIGKNLEKVGTIESMNAFLELYDTGRIGVKVKVNTSDNKRVKSIEGVTPANMLLFGTPHNLLDSGAMEKRWMSLLETGYARRCLFAWADETAAMPIGTADEIYARLTSPINEAVIQKWRQHFATLADPSKLGWTVSTSEDVDKLLISYKLDCIRRIRHLSEFDTIRRTEMENRYSRALKVAGTLAFIDESLDLTEDHLKAAIRVTEESGESFQAMMSREPVQAKLARYIASAKGRELTQSELIEELPFFKAVSKGERNDLLSLAQGWGYRSHIVLKRRYLDGIELYSGEMLKETNLSEVSLSYSDEYSHGYEYGVVAFEDLPQLTQAPDLHWANHNFLDGHRCEDKAIPGFDLMIFDVDGGTAMDMAHELLSDFVFMTHTTKRHTEEENRYRLIMPMNYELRLDAEDYREFYRNVISWLPFEVDESTVDRSRKWATNANGIFYQNLEGRMFDVLPFVPRTKKNEERQKEIKELGSLDNLERWFVQRISTGNRNNNMLKYALALVYGGTPYNEVEARVMAFNARLSNGMEAEELRRTVLVTAAKRCQELAL